METLPDLSWKDCSSDEQTEALQLATTAFRAMLAYDDPSTVEARFQKQGQGEADPVAASVFQSGQNFVHIEQDNSYACAWEEVSGGETDLYLVFRGTEITSMQDVEDDLEAIPSTADWFPQDARVHEGFLEHLAKVQPQLDELLAQAAAQNVRHVSFIGHSLGGATAFLAAYRYLALKGNLPVAITTFAAPRIGSEAFSRWSGILSSVTSTPVQVVVNKEDIVPSLPFFFHIPWFTKRKVLHRAQDLGPLEAHSMKEYYSRCKAVPMKKR